MTEHRTLGLELAAMRDELTHILTWLGNEHLPNNRVATRSLRLAIKRLDESRSDLENVMFEEHHPEASTGTYYPDPEDRATWQASQAERVRLAAGRGAA